MINRGSAKGSFSYSKGPAKGSFSYFKNSHRNYSSLTKKQHYVVHQRNGPDFPSGFILSCYYTNAANTFSCKISVGFNWLQGDIGFCRRTYLFNSFLLKRLPFLSFIFHLHNGPRWWWKDLSSTYYSTSVL